MSHPLYVHMHSFRQGAGLSATFSFTLRFAQSPREVAARAQRVVLSPRSAHRTGPRLRTKLRSLRSSGRMCWPRWTDVADTFDAGPNAVMFARNKDVGAQLLKRLLYQLPPSSDADFSRYVIGDQSLLESTGLISLKDIDALAPQRSCLHKATEIRCLQRSQLVQHNPNPGP